MLGMSSMKGVGGRGNGLGDLQQVRDDGKYLVPLNVNNLTPLNNCVHWSGLDIFHSVVKGRQEDWVKGGSRDAKITLCVERGEGNNTYSIAVSTPSVNHVKSVKVAGATSSSPLKVT